MEAVPKLPPGFRFRPTDEELVEHYLLRKALSCPLPAAVIPDIDAPGCDPWEIPGGGAVFAEKERYFFTRRQAGSGCWKPRGKDRRVVASDRVVGLKRTLVFRGGRRPPLGPRTDWVMHEYRLVDTPIKQREAWVLCCLFPTRRRRARRGTNCPRHTGRGRDLSDSESSCVTEISELSSDGEEVG